jgi:hypothetical protein
MRGDLLQQQLLNVTKEFEKSQETFGSIMSYAQSAEHLAAQKERRLVRENEQLQVSRKEAFRWNSYLHFYLLT